jgi:2-dehydro-3-deoxygluconokinase
MPDVITFGETMALFSANETGHLRNVPNWRLGIGGAESNLAVGLRRLGVDADWSGRVGDDVLGELIVHTLRAEGLQLRSVTVDRDAPTGLMLKERRTGTWTRVHYFRTGSAGSRLGPGDIDIEAMQNARVLHVTGITMALSDTARSAVDKAVTAARDAGVTVSLDLNYRSALWSEETAAPALRTLAGRADILFATGQEARMLTGDLPPDQATQALQSLGPHEVIIKRAADGAVARVGHAFLQSPSVRVSAVDSVGAGDAFAAGYLAQRLRSASPEACLRSANEAGAFAVSARGDWEALAFTAELELLRHSHGDTTR